MSSGIYKIQSKVDGKVYVGLAYNLERRKEFHFRRLLLGKHSNRHLQNTYNKYGKDNLEFIVLELCEKELLCSKELHYATELDSHNKEKGFNIRPIFATTRNGALAEETKEIIRQKNKSFRHTEEMKRYLSESKKGLPCHPNTLKAVRNQKNKYKFSKEDRIAANNALSKAVVQLDLEGNFIGEFESITIAAASNGFKGLGVSLACNNKIKKYKNFIWKFKTKL